MRGTRLIPVLLLSMTLLAGCASASGVKLYTPPMQNPPASVVTALEETGKKDPDAASWTVWFYKYILKVEHVNG